MEDTLLKIVNCAFDLFTKYGIRSITMDDISSKLGISKKTLYQCIPNKADLVKKIIESHIESDYKIVEEIKSKPKNAIEEMVAIGKYVYKQLKLLNITTLYDLKKHYLNSWELLENHKNNFVYTVIAQNIENGIKEGLYRKDINISIAAHFYITKSQILSEDTFFEAHNLTPADIYFELLKHHLYGIASKKGLEYLEKNIENIKNQRNVN